jgi:hypothetical protein
MFKRLIQIAGLALLLLVSAGGIGGAGTPGGFAPAKIDSDEVRRAAAFAVEKQAKAEGVALELETIVDAQQQVVAGMNYRLTLKLNSGGKTTDARAVIFRGLDQHYELKSWDWLR